MNRRKIVLVLVRYYLPGFRSGGPVRTISNMVEQLSDDFEFKIITMDRDHGTKAPYVGIDADDWNQVGRAQVYYLSSNLRSMIRLAKLVLTTPHDVLYLNSAFDPVFTLWPLLIRRLRRYPRCSVVLAPRGEFSEGALQLKGGKKRSFLRVARAIGFYRDIVWQASSVYEKIDIGRALAIDADVIRIAGNVNAPIVIAPDLVIFKEAEFHGKGRGNDNRLRVLFLSRITPKKNLDYALRVLARVKRPMQFSICGPIGDLGYWRQCQDLIEALPLNVQVDYLGEIEHAEVSAIMRSHDLFFFPSRGENYGHVIAEALMAGTPVLLSDVTAWRGMEEAGVGWDLPLSGTQRFVEQIDYCAGLDDEYYQEWRNRILRYASEKLGGMERVKENLALFGDLPYSEI